MSSATARRRTRLAVAAAVLGGCLAVAAAVPSSTSAVGLALPVAAAPRTAVVSADPAVLAGTSVTSAAVALHLQAASAPRAAAPATTTPIGWLHTSGSTIRTASGAVFTIRAVNWFGMETPNCAPHGLWQLSLNSAVATMASLGFNTIRLPFSNQCIEGAPVSSVDYQLNPGLQGKNTLQIMDAVIASAKAHGMAVILDRHRPDSGSQSALWYTAQYPQSTWIADWRMLATRYRNNPTVIGADLHNEPHGSACWGCGDPTRDWAAAAVRGGDAVLSVDPHLLIIVEGIENQGNGNTTWWGGGLADVAHHPISLDVAHQLVYSVHDYPASVYAQRWFSASTYPNNLVGVWNANFGFIQSSHLAPVFVGEFGTRLATTSDRQWLTHLVSYLKSTGMSFGYWSYNPDSGDTGGLVADDWTTLETAKLTALQPLLGTVRPSPPSPPSASPAPPATPSPAPRPSPSPSPTSSVPAGKGVLVASWALQSSWNAGYVTDITVSVASGSHTGWVLSWPDPHAAAVVNAWGMTCSVGGGLVHCTGSGWAGSVTAGSPVAVGAQIAGDGTAPTHPLITIG